MTTRTRTISIVAALVVLALAWYLLSPLWTTNELREPSPLVGNAAMDKATAGMNPVKKRRYEQAMEQMADDRIEEIEPMPTDGRTLATGNFSAVAHDVSGTALLLEVNGQKTLRLENFATLNGPNLHIYLAADDDSDFVDLGAIKATHGDINYAVPSDVDLNRYHRVLVWCVPFKVLFGAATLQ